MLSCHTSQQYFKDIAIVFPSESAADATVFGYEPQPPGRLLQRR